MVWGFGSKKDQTSEEQLVIAAVPTAESTGISPDMPVPPISPDAISVSEIPVNNSIDSIQKSPPVATFENIDESAVPSSIQLDQPNTIPEIIEETAVVVEPVVDIAEVAEVTEAVPVGAAMEQTVAEKPVTEIDFDELLSAPTESNEADPVIFDEGATVGVDRETKNLIEIGDAEIEDGNEAEVVKTELEESTEVPTTPEVATEAPVAEIAKETEITEVAPVETAIEEVADNETTIPLISESDSDRFIESIMPKANIEDLTGKSVLDEAVTTEEPENEFLTQIKEKEDDFNEDVEIKLQKAEALQDKINQNKLLKTQKEADLKKQKDKLEEEEAELAMRKGELDDVANQIAEDEKELTNLQTELDEIMKVILEAFGKTKKPDQNIEPN